MLNRYLLLSAALLLSACSDTSPVLSTVPDPSKQLLWQQTSADFFLEQGNQLSDLALAQELKAMLIAIDTQTDALGVSPVRASAASATPLNFELMMNESVHSAAKERTLQQIKLYLLHQHISFEDVILSQNDLAFIRENISINIFLQSLKKLMDENSVLAKGDFEIYETNNEQGLLAYSRRIDNRRAYIAYNLSFDIHKMPLPFGFMTSTKVRLWQSDDTQIREFVTTSPIMLRPFTAVVIFVG